MEISDERIHALECAWGIDEYVSFGDVIVVFGVRCGVGGKKMLDAPHTRRADRDAAAGEGREQRALRRSGEFVNFPMDGVGLNR